MSLTAGPIVNFPGVTGGAASTAFDSVCQVRLNRSSATQCSLRGFGNGRLIEINGEVLNVLAFNNSILDVGSNLIDATGGDSGFPMVASTFYYVYASNASATDFPLDVRGSLTAPIEVSGVFYLGIAGNALNWRLVGWVRTNSAIQFEDLVNNRAVASYYNRRRASIVLTPGYNNNNLVTTYTQLTATWNILNAGAGALASWIANGEDAAEFVLCAVAENALTPVFVGLGQNSSTNAAVGAESAAVVITELTLRYVVNPAVGFNDVRMLGHGDGVNATTYYADLGRSGATSDVIATALYGTVWI